MAKEEQDRLTREAVAATKAGMSYGNWKAQQLMQAEAAARKAQEQARVKKAAPKPGAKPRPLCRICGNPIPEFSRRRSFCSAECAKAAADQKYRI